jgi:leucyl aminopeptidase
MSLPFTTSADTATPVHLLRPHDVDSTLADLTPAQAAWVRTQDFKGQAGRILLVPGPAVIDQVLCGLGDGVDPMVVRAIPATVPQGTYQITTAPDGFDLGQAALAWGLGAYRFDRYKPNDKPQPVLLWPAGVDAGAITDVLEAAKLACDLVNMPANDLGPDELAMTALGLADRFGARITQTLGEALANGYPLVHAVGKGSVRPPRFVELSWGSSGPHVVVIGKGVVFDSGGLDIKVNGGMRLMKKDMGGAAHAFALAQMVMAAKLPLRLTVLLPLVENAVSGASFRPGDIIRSRKGLTVEIDDTDAEGRLILADALARAGELEPDLTLDFATLTGAARVALGPELPPFYTDDEALAADITRHAEATRDPVWRMPLWMAYDSALDSPIADIKNLADGVQAGSVTAALFLKRFAPQGAWAHFDIYAWNERARPGHPKGGACQAIRGVFALLCARYGAA